MTQPTEYICVDCEYMTLIPEEPFRCPYCGGVLSPHTEDSPATTPTGHTPGNWKTGLSVFGEHNETVYLDIIGPDGENIAAIYNPELPASEANARLIASAPTMAKRIEELEKSNKALECLADTRSRLIGRHITVNADLTDALTIISNATALTLDDGKRMRKVARAALNKATGKA